MPKPSRKIVVVAGPTGELGRAVIARLRTRGFGVRALTHDSNTPEARALVGQGTEVVHADLSLPGTLPDALEGASAVCGMEVPVEEGIGTELQHGINLADAAARTSSVKHMVYISSAGADRHTGIPYFDNKFKLEEHIRNRGLPWTVLRPAFLMENWLGMRSAIEEGALRLPLTEDTRLPMIAADDVGTFAAMAVERQGHWRGREVELASDELSMGELAEAFTRKAGRPVNYAQIPWDQFEHLEGPTAALVYRWYQKGELRIDIGALRQEQPNLTTFEKWLQTRWQAGERHFTA